MGCSLWGRKELDTAEPHTKWVGVGQRVTGHWGCVASCVQRNWGLRLWSELCDLGLDAYPL